MKSLESEEEAEGNQDRGELERSGARKGTTLEGGGGWSETEGERGGWMKRVGTEWSRKRAEGVAAGYGPYYGVK